MAKVALRLVYPKKNPWLTVLAKRNSSLIHPLQQTLVILLIDRVFRVERVSRAVLLQSTPPGAILLQCGAEVGVRLHKMRVQAYPAGRCIFAWAYAGFWRFPIAIVKWTVGTIPRLRWSFPRSSCGLRVLRRN